MASNRPTPSWRRAIGPLLVLGLVATACGDDDGDATTTTTTTTTTTSVASDDAIDEDGPVSDADPEPDAPAPDDPAPDDPTVDDRPASTDGWTVTLGGVGAVGIGMAIEEAAAEIGFDTSDPAFTEESEFCAGMGPADGSPYEGLFLMVYDGVVQRIDVWDGDWRTPSGVGLGDTMQDLVRAYGDSLEISPHRYDENGFYVEFIPSDPGNEGLSLLFEINDDVVSTYRVGFTEPVGFVEGCS